MDLSAQIESQSNELKAFIVKAKLPTQFKLSYLYCNFKVNCVQSLMTCNRKKTSKFN